MSRENVGVIKCPFTGAPAVVRADCRGKLYFYSQAGKIAPNLPQGQRWLRENMAALDGFTIDVIAIGAPPMVSKKALTEEGDKARVEIPLTEAPAKDSGSIMEFFR